MYIVRTGSWQLGRFYGGSVMIQCMTCGSQPEGPGLPVAIESIWVIIETRPCQLEVVRPLRELLDSESYWLYLDS